MQASAIHHIPIQAVHTKYLLPTRPALSLNEASIDAISEKGSQLVMKLKITYIYRGLIYGNCACLHPRQTFHTLIDGKLFFRSPAESRQQLFAASQTRFFGTSQEIVDLQVHFGQDIMTDISHFVVQVGFGILRFDKMPPGC